MPESLGDKFIAWARKVYIPAAEADSRLSAPMFTRILTQVEPDTVSFSIQFRATDADAARLWHEQNASRLHQQLHRLMDGQLVYFTTFMEEL